MPDNLAESAGQSVGGAISWTENRFWDFWLGVGKRLGGPITPTDPLTGAGPETLGSESTFGHLAPELGHVLDGAGNIISGQDSEGSAPKPINWTAVGVVALAVVLAIAAVHSAAKG